MPSDKQATAIAVILLVFPDFILPLEVKCFRPTGWVLNAETGFYGQKASVSTDALQPQIFKREMTLELLRAKTPR